VADVLVVSAFKLGDPLAFGVEMVADNFSLHPRHPNGPRRFCDGPAVLDRPRIGNGNFVTPARLNLGLASICATGKRRRGRMTRPSHGKSGDDHDFVTANFSTVSAVSFLLTGLSKGKRMILAVCPSI
jgi:hypothetical protein